MVRSLIGSVRSIASGRTVVIHDNNIIYNSNFEIAPAVLTAQTSTAIRWIDGTSAGSTARSALGWAVTSSGLTSSAAAGFDNTVSHSGTYSMKLSTLNSTGAVTVSNLRDAASASVLYQTFPLLPSTAYVLTFWVKTNNVATNGAFIDLRQYNAAVTALATTSSTKTSGTADWTKITLSLTSNASAAFGVLFLRNNVAGNTSDAWFDDITLTTVPVRSQTG